MFFVNQDFVSSIQILMLKYILYYSGLIHKNGICVIFFWLTKDDGNYSGVDQDALAQLAILVTQNNAMW